MTAPRSVWKESATLCFSPRLTLNGGRPTCFSSAAWTSANLRYS